ncbi:hydrophobe/amphiphile efflux-3 (HAE3) family protein [Dehalogenimonas alkenigignens]|uniref:Hydrophobe/amphiphile efflux-3 (HAE3) family protein n=1 Tax=Dehalogenimonas alkenigignens TaxID=1217799 RepID=A0A0W0GGX7_9CHLR|nr:hydrophobe/amphiphile efflux-3 (HAE3) family transporter [Dehalogenimonas alkenigignens]KTB47818.1 hydrophobe/amphiphile efflux-3 (HAE3) family protein [Dehalogenimonas alkenigignens]
MNTLFRHLGRFIENRRILIIGIGVLFLVGSLYGATRLTFATGIETMVSTDSQVYQDYLEFNEHFGAETIIVLARAERLSDLTSLQNITALDTIEQQLSSESGVLSVIGPGFALRQAMAQITGAAILPPDQMTLDSILFDNGVLRPDLKNLFPSDGLSIVIITLKGDVAAEQIDAVVASVQSAIERASFVGVEGSVTGTSVIFSEMETLLSKSMGIMVGISILLMLLILAVVFSVRGFFAWRWLPLGAVIIGSIYVFGMMGWLSVPVTMVSMAILPILIGLGVDYAVQFHNRYDEEARRGETVAEAIIDSVTHIGPAIAIAIVAAALGFIALFISPVPMIQQFGLMLVLGIIACYLVSLFILLPVLYMHDRRKNSKTTAKLGKNTTQTGLVERGLEKLAPWVIRNPLLIIIVAGVFAVVGVILDNRIPTETDEFKYISQDLPIMKDFNELSQISGGSAAFNILVKGSNVISPETLKWMLEIEGQILDQSTVPVVSASGIADTVAQIGQGQIPPTQAAVDQALDYIPSLLKANLLTPDNALANITVRTGPEVSIAKLQELKTLIEGYVASPPVGVTAVVTGQGILGIEILNSLTTGRTEMTLLGVGLVFIGLFLLFRFNLPRALIATLPIAMIIGWSNIVMFLGSIKYTALTATLGSLIIGIGVEFTILMMMRYNEERNKGEDPKTAMTTAMTKIGRAVITSGLTVIGGFGALLFARDFPIVTDFGAVTMINVGFALVSSLVVLPTVIVAVDTRKERKLSKLGGSG